MEESRTSLWSRLVVFYSVNKRDQLNPEVMAEIISKYGSKEEELSARLLKKYGRPLPASVPSQQLRRVLVEFGMDDQDSAAGEEGKGGIERADPGDRLSPRSSSSLPTTSSAGVAGVAMEAAAASAKAEVERRQQAANDKQKPRQGEGSAAAGRRAKKPPKGSELNFRSEFFDPLQALRHKNLRPPFPSELALDNIAKFYRMLPQPPAGTAAAAAAAATAGGAAATGEPVAAVERGAADSGSSSSAAATAAALLATIPARPSSSTRAGATPAAAAAAVAAAVGFRASGAGPPIFGRPGAGEAPAPGTATVQARTGDFHHAGEEKPSFSGSSVSSARRAGVQRESDGSFNGGDGEAGVGGSVGGHYGPSVCSAADMKRVDKQRALRRRMAETSLIGDGGGAAAGSVEDRLNPVQRIIRQYAGIGPYSLLYRLHEEKRRASVMIRNVNSVRGTCTGLIRAFDKHMNMLLVDVREEYTTLMPAREPRSPSKSSSSKLRPKPRSLSPTDPAGHEAMEVDGYAGNTSTQIKDIGSAIPARAASVDSGGEGEGSGGGVPVDGSSGRARVHGVADPHASAAPEGGGVAIRAGGAGAGAGAAAACDEEVSGSVPADAAISMTEAAVGSARDTGTLTSGRTSEAGGGEGRDGASGNKKWEIPSGDNLKRHARGPVAVVAAAKASAWVAFDEARQGEGGTVARQKYFAENWGVESEREEGQRGSEINTKGEGKSPGPPPPPPPPPGRGKDSGNDEREEEDGKGEGAGSRTPPETNKKSVRRSRVKGRWTGELKPVRRRRFLKQLLIRGDNVVMIWEASKS